ncbi:c-type cytochrome [Cupriavidus basilensis]
MHSLIACGIVALALYAAPARGDDSPVDPRRIDAGCRVYAAQCAACHGLRGEGQPAWDRPNAAGELPAPPHDREGHTWKIWTRCCTASSSTAGETLTTRRNT